MLRHRLRTAGITCEIELAHSINRHVETYFSIVLRNACCASRVSLSTSVSKMTKIISNRDYSQIMVGWLTVCYFSNLLVEVLLKLCPQLRNIHERRWTKINECKGTWTNTKIRCFWTRTRMHTNEQKWYCLFMFSLIQSSGCISFISLANDNCVLSILLWISVFT